MVIINILAPLTIGTIGRSGASQWPAEGVATFTLVLAILGGLRYAPQAMPWLVGLTVMRPFAESPLDRADQKRGNFVQA